MTTITDPLANQSLPLKKIAQKPLLLYASIHGGPAKDLSCLLLSLPSLVSIVRGPGFQYISLTQSALRCRAVNINKTLRQILSQDKGTNQKLLKIPIPSARRLKDTGASCLARPPHILGLKAVVEVTNSAPLPSRGIPFSPLTLGKLFMVCTDTKIELLQCLTRCLPMDEEPVYSSLERLEPLH